MTDPAMDRTFKLEGMDIEGFLTLTVAKSIADITVQFGIEYLRDLHSNPGSLSLMTIEMLDGPTQQRHLNYSSDRTWKHYELIQLSKGIRELTVVVKSSIWGDLTRYHLSEHQLMGFTLKADVEKIPIKTRPESTGDASDSQDQMTLLIRVSQSMAHDQTSEPEAALWARCVHYNTVLSQSGPSVTTLDETLPDIQRLLGTTPPDSPVRLRTLMLLASATLDRSLRSEQPHNNALNNVESLLDELSNGSWVLRPEFQAGIAQLRSKVQQARRKAVIYTCRALAEQSLEAAEALGTKGDVTQFQAVNKRLRDLVATTPMNDTLRPGIISMLAENLLSCARGKEGYDVGYLSDAIDCLEQAFPSSSRSKVGLRQASTSSGPMAGEGNGLQSVRRTLYAALRLRYALLNKDEDLERMFTLLPSGTDDPRALLELGELLYTRFELQKGNLSDINRSIDLQKNAIQMALAGEHENESTSAQPGRKEATWLSRAYNNLALAFEARFKLSDDLVDLYECLRYFRKTLPMPLAPGQDSSVHFGTFQHLASSLAYYALNHQDSDHLEEIMTLLVDLVSLLPPDGAERSLISPHLLWAVALTLGSMAKHLKNPDLLRTLPKKMARPELNLYPGLSTAEVFQAYIDFNLDPSPETKEKSMPIIVKFFQASLASCDNIAVKLGLARILIAQPQWYHPPQGDESTSLTSEGMTLLKECFNSPPEHDSTFHYFLGQLFGGPGGLDQFEKARSHFARATSDAKLPLERLEAAYEWAEMALKVKSTDCMTAFDVIVTTISEIAGLERTIEKRHRILSGLSSRVLQAAEAALSFEEVDKALEFLERGRGLVWSQLNTLRTPLDELRSHDPALASRLESVSQMLEGAGGQSRTLEEGLGHTMEMRLSLQEQEVTHIKWAREREELIESVRSKIPGFLRPLPSSEWLTDLPTSGPVVVLQAHKARCDAIVLVPGLHEPMHIPLPHFSPRRAGQLRDLLRSSLLENKLLLRGEQERAIREAGKKTISQTLRSILKQLWSGLVKPILDGLAFSRSETPTTRIWWCPTGALTSLPIHAAGIYEGPDSESIFDYAVSSYTPAVSTLTRRVRHSRQAPADNVGVCLLSQANAPGLARISGTRDEVDQLARLLDSDCPSARTVRLEDEVATQQGLIDAMDSCSWIHLACHGMQETGQPLKSGFALADGRLELGTIIKLDLKHAEFAFLSACETSTGDVQLSEESVHLAAGMLATGFRSVVGTMWSIPDRQAPQVAQDFYRELLGRSTEVDGKRTLDAEQAAYALHHAVQALRKRVGDSKFEDWAQYVHFGV